MGSPFPNHPDLRFQRYPEHGRNPVLHLMHQRQVIDCRTASRCDKKIGMNRADDNSSLPESFAPGFLNQPSGGITGGFLNTQPRERSATG